MKKNSSRRTFIAGFIIFISLFLSLCFIFVYISDSIQKATALPSVSSLPITPIVVIDAGHGGEDGGTVGKNGALEKDINLSLAKKLKVFLASLGIQSVLTRSDDRLLYDKNVDYQGRKKALDMQERLKIANSYQNVIFISIHQNSFPSERYNGFQVYYSQNNESSHQLATLLENTVRSKLQPDNNRACKASDGKIYLLDKLACTAVLVECGFLSNVEECELLCTEEYQNKLAALVSSVILDFLNTDNSQIPN